MQADAPQSRSAGVIDWSGCLECWKGVEVGVCALWGVTEPSQKRREMSMWLLDDDNLAAGEELPINAPQ